MTNIQTVSEGSTSRHINTGDIPNTELSNTAVHSRSVVCCIHDRLWDPAYK